MKHLKKGKFSIGTHWIAIRSPGHHTLEVFDSLGLRNNEKLFKKFVKFEGMEINQYPVQESTSLTCAQFVIYYICNRFYNGKYFISI